MKRVAGPSEPVVAPESIFARRHETRPPQVGQMPRRLRLRHAQHIDQIAHAQLPAPQQMQNPQPRPVGKRPEHHIHSGWVVFGCHMRTSEYSMTCICSSSGRCQRRTWQENAAIQPKWFVPRGSRCRSPGLSAGGKSDKRIAPTARHSRTSRHLHHAVHRGLNDQIIFFIFNHSAVARRRIELVLIFHQQHTWPCMSNIPRSLGLRLPTGSDCSWALSAYRTPWATTPVSP